MFLLMELRSKTLEDYNKMTPEELKGIVDQLVGIIEGLQMKQCSIQYVFPQQQYFPPQKSEPDICPLPHYPYNPNPIYLD